MVTFSTKKKLLTVGEHAVVDQEAIAHVIGLLASQRDLNFQEVLATELTAYHHLQYFMLMVMRVAAVKSTLKKNVQVYVSQRFIMSPTAIVYFVVDVLAVIWTLEWPTHGTVATFISGFKMWLSLQLSEADVCVLTGITTTPSSKVAVDLPEQQLAMSTMSH